MNNPSKLPLSTIRQFAENNPAFTPASLRWLIFNEAQNGLAQSGAIIRIGRKVLIDENLFLEWVRSQNGKAA